jgi:hypothetical protein
VTDVVSLAVMAAGLAWLGRESFVWLGPADRGAGHPSNGVETADTSCGSASFPPRS